MEKKDLETLLLLLTDKGKELLRRNQELTPRKETEGNVKRETQEGKINGRCPYFTVIAT